MYLCSLSAFKSFSLLLVISSNKFIRDNVSDREENNRILPTTSHCYPGNKSSSLKSISGCARILYGPEDPVFQNYEIM